MIGMIMIYEYETFQPYIIDQIDKSVFKINNKNCQTRFAKITTGDIISSCRSSPDLNQIS